MRVVICDDDSDELESISRLVSELGHTVLAFTNPAEVLAAGAAGIGCDAYLLDILMPGMSGIELAASLRQRGCPGAIIFLSHSNDFGAQSYAVRAFHYLLKPPSAESLADAFNRIAAQQAIEDDGLTVLTSGGASFIRFREIAVVEADHNYVIFTLNDGQRIRTRATMVSVAEQMLYDQRFVQCHQSFIVNMASIAAISKREITLANKRLVPISRKYAAAKQTYLLWSLRR